MTEKTKPFIVPITDLDLLKHKLGRRTFRGAPVGLENVGTAAALNIVVHVDFLGGRASEPAQPFRSTALSAGDSIYLGHLMSTGDNPKEFVMRMAHYRISCDDIWGNKYEFECKDGVVAQNPAGAS